MKVEQGIRTLLLLSVGVGAIPALGNGYSPAVPPTAIAIEATCHDRSGHDHQLSAVMIGGRAGESRELQFQRGDAVETIGLELVKRVEIDAQSPDPDGYTPAHLSPVGDGPFEAQLKTFEQQRPLELRGITPYGSAMSIDLAKCASIVFNASEPAPPEEATPPAMAQ